LGFTLFNPTYNLPPKNVYSFEHLSKENDMTHKILAAIDTSPLSRWVFNSASSIAKQSNGQLGLLHVLTQKQFEDIPLPKLNMLEEYPTKSDSAFKCHIGRLEPQHLDGTHNPELNLLKSYTREATAHGISAEFFQCIGEPATVICDFAKLWEADLIVIGHRGRSGLVEMVLGSVSNHVAHHALCSVYIVRPTLQTSSTELKSIETVLR
jgi:nucleotide-binding universal stress UspA family protein